MLNRGKIRDERGGGGRVFYLKYVPIMGIEGRGGEQGN